jgi:stearoyl-CoA desaturase (delta-9 desaturase)
VAIGGTWRAALAALLWAGLVRVAVLQHVTGSVNSPCHVSGTRPFATRSYDRAANLWPLVPLSFGESWQTRTIAIRRSCRRYGYARRRWSISAPRC